MSDEENTEAIPDRNTCQKLTEDFAEITKTNEALAQTFLQDHEWNLERSVSAFYEELAKEQSLSQLSTAVTVPPVDFQDSETVEKLFGKGKCVTSVPPPLIKLLSWNVDGLDTNNLKRRTQSVIKLIKKLEPDIIFLQEIIPETAEYYSHKLPEYKVLAGDHEGYFTLTLLRIFTVFYDSHRVIPYRGSKMNRNILEVQAHSGANKYTLLNTHLESTKDFSEERKKQLGQLFNHAKSFPPEINVILGGDLNLRDKEENTPPGFHDLWIACGSPKEFQYTWDMTRNTNLKQNFGKFKPRLRFDRIYMRRGSAGRVTPQRFALVGCEKVAQSQSFPSDHWGILIIFDAKH